MIVLKQLEAAIKAAHDATHQANVERQRWQEKSESLLTEQRRNEMKERQLMQRAKDLEELTQVSFSFISNIVTSYESKNCYFLNSTLGTKAG